jgi:chromosome segregation ATPase
LTKRRAYIAERLPEIMLEWQRLKDEGEHLKDELTKAPPEQSGRMKQRLNYVRARIIELRQEQRAAIDEREDISNRLKELKPA